MIFPFPAHIEIPVLHELAAAGGADHLRFVYNRLIPYFPEINRRENLDWAENKNWRRAVQKAGKQLEEKNLIRRAHGVWSLTDAGRRTVESENANIEIITSDFRRLNHDDLQRMILEIGKNLGYDVQKEFEFYDVVWRESENSPRLSHVFEVQSKGNIDSAFAKLKRSYHNQRSHPFLIISEESDVRRARKSLAAEFSELAAIIRIFSFAEIEKVHRNLADISAILPFFLAK